MKYIVEVAGQASGIACSWLFAGLLALTPVLLVAVQQPLELADNFRTEYRIVIAGNPLPGDSYAAEVLAENLLEKTGATFEISETPAAGGKNIFVGVAPDAATLAADSTLKPLEELAESEFVTQSSGQAIYLYGEGIHGGFYAVVDFMEKQMGWRWFNFYDKPVIPIAEKFILPPFARTVRFRFPYRLRQGRKFYAFHGVNMGLTEMNTFSMKRYGRLQYDERLQSKKLTPVFVHTCYGFIPPTPEMQKHKERLDWMTKTNYAETNPEFFALQKNGTRTPYLHLCWSNAELRKVLTETLEEQIRRSGSNCIIVVDTGDDAVRGPLCLCEGCKSLSKKYGTLAAPCLDYVLEVADLFRERYPDVVLRTELFRFDTDDPKYTYRIPTLPDGRSIPDNLHFFIAQKGYINRPVDHPDNGNFYAALQEARKLTPNLALWNYPHFFFQADLMPFSSLKLQVDDFFKIKDLIQTHFDEAFFSMYTFNGLENYVIMKLLKDESVDVDEVVDEYISHRYGAAAGSVKLYQEELEDVCVNWEYPLNYSYSAFDFNKQFAWLTPERLLRWQKLFDLMMSATDGNEKVQRNLARLRITLDAATLARWNVLIKHAPDYFADHKAVYERLEMNRKRDWNPYAESHRKLIEDWILMIEIGEQKKPLPERFAGHDEGDIIRVVPVNHGRSSIKMVKDPDAAFGYAVTIEKPDLPFNFGFYQKDLKTLQLKRTISAEEMPEPGVYTLFELGEDIVLSRECQLWFSSRSWQTHARLDDFFDLNFTTQAWRGYVSLKFPENYAGLDSDQVLCDQIILIKKTTDD